MVPKFRFFDTEENKMHVVDSLYTFKSLGGKDITIATEDIDLSEWRSYSDGVLMQYTGLKDKNGVEIFEGDIVKTKCGERGRHIGVVTFRPGEFVAKGVKQYKGYVEEINGTFEIIGNKYEHPHLLEGDNE